MSAADTSPTSTAFTDLVGCAVPLQLAVMAGVSTTALAAAVASAGGLGMLAGVALGPAEVTRRVTEASDAAGDTGRIGVGFLMPFFDVSAFEAAAASAPVVECFWGEPDADLALRAHDAAALLSWQVGSVDEALAAVDAGCDLVVVQGVEAGGHVRGAEPLLALVESVRARVDVPLVASGGIGSGTQAVAALAAGADAVRVGTRFLAATEADVHPDYLAALTAAAADDTVLTEAFSAGWPDAPHRVLRSCVEASDADPATRSVFPPVRAYTGDTAASALYAGESVGAVDGPTTAAAIVAEFRDALSRVPDGH